jgi:hypothetical protein
LLHDEQPSRAGTASIGRLKPVPLCTSVTAGTAASTADTKSVAAIKAAALKDFLMIATPVLVSFAKSDGTADGRRWTPIKTNQN